jgi:hypothetical protein
MYICSSDLSKVNASDYLTVMVPVAIPFRLMRSEDFLVNNMATLWPSVMTKVIGNAYSAEPFPLDIATRLARAEENLRILSSGITELTQTQVTLT